MHCPNASWPWQAWGHDSFLGELFTVLDHPLSAELVPNTQLEHLLMSWWYRRERKRASGKKVKRNTFPWKLLITAGHLGKTVTGRQLHKVFCWQQAVYAQTPSWSSPALNRKELGFNGRSMYLCSQSCVPFNSSAHQGITKKVSCSADAWMTKFPVRWRLPVPPFPPVKGCVIYRNVRIRNYYAVTQHHTWSFCDGLHDSPIIAEPFEIQCFL